MTRTKFSLWVLTGIVVGVLTARLCVPLVAQTIKCNCQVFTTGSFDAGTSGSPALRFTTAPTKGWYLFSSTGLGFSGHLVPGADASYDLGVTGTNRVRNAFLSGNVLANLIEAGNGTSGSPSLTFSTTTSLGLYRFSSTALGATGHLYPSADATLDLGLDTQRWRDTYASRNTFANTLRLGWNATANLNTLLSVNPGTYPAMLIVSNGSGGARGDILANRLSLGNPGDPTFTTPFYSVFNVNDTWTAALSAENLFVVSVISTVNQTGAATQTAGAGRFVIGSTTASDQLDLIALSLATNYNGSATLANAEGLDVNVYTEGTVTAQYGAYVLSDGTGAIVDNYTMYLDSVYSSPTLTNQYGLYMNDQTVAGTTLDYAIFYNAPFLQDFSVAADGSVNVGQGILSIGNGIARLENTAQTTGIRLQFAGVPTISSGFGTAAAIIAGSTDSEGTIDIGTGGIATAGVIAFQTTWASAPRCFVQDSTTNVAVRASTITTTAVTFTSPGAWTANDKLLWWCVGTK